MKRLRCFNHIRIIRSCFTWTQDGWFGSLLQLARVPNRPPELRCTRSTASWSEEPQESNHGSDGSPQCRLGGQQADIGLGSPLWVSGKGIFESSPILALHSGLGIMNYIARWWQLKDLLFSPRSLWRWSNLTSIFFRFFQMGWNH